MKHLLALFLSFLNLTIFAQGYQFADTTKKWTSIIIGHGSWMVHTCSPTIFHEFREMNPDDEYLDVYESMDSLELDWHEVGLIREDTLTGKVYFRKYNDLDEGLLYDFSLQPGDTVQVVNEFIDEIVAPMICDSVDMVNVNGVLKKRIFLNSFYNPDVLIETWIEGVGSSYGIMNSGLTASGIVGSSASMLCCSQNNTTIWMDSLFANCYLNEFYPQFVSYTYDTAYMNEYYEYTVAVDTGDADSIELTAEKIPEGFTFDPVSGVLSGTPSETGEFWCIITAKNLHYNFLTDMVYDDLIVVLPTRTNIPDKQKDIRLYPNPFATNINIEIAEKGNYLMELYSSKGKLVRSIDFQNSTTIDVSNLNSGIYLAKLIDEAGNVIMTERVVKQ